MLDWMGTELSVASQKSLSRHADLAGMPLHSLGQYGAALTNVVSSFMRRELAPHGLNNLDFTLIRLFLTDQEWTASELAEIMPMDNPAISRVVSKLVDKGILERRRPREDRRIVLLKLTEDGVSLGLELHDKLHSYEAKLMEGVQKEEIEALRSTIEKVLQNHNALEQLTESADSGLNRYST